LASAAPRSSARLDFESFKREFDADPYHAGLGITVVSRGQGRGCIRLDKGPTTPGGIGGSVHGGVLASMVDTAMLVAVFSDLPDNAVPAGTADLSITYLRPAHGSYVLADATVVKRGRQLAVIDVDLTNDAGTLCAKGRVLYALRSAGA